MRSNVVANFLNTEQRRIAAGEAPRGQAPQAGTKARLLSVFAGAVETHILSEGSRHAQDGRQYTPVVATAK